MRLHVHHPCHGHMLHHVLLAAMEWTDSHLHEFEIAGNDLALSGAAITAQCQTGIGTATS